MNASRFELALKLLPPASWERFERLASQFLSAEFPSLRTVASPSGDGGRDAQLFATASDPSVVLQYSVAEDWRKKLVATAKRLQETMPETKVLIYVTNQVIGADGDELRQNLIRNANLFVDYRDRSWFIERFRASPQQEAAAEELAAEFVDPYLAAEGAVRGKAAALEGDELRTAFVYLELQWEDETRDKGLTKLAFEALVRAALRHTDSEHRMSRAAIKQRVREMVKAHTAEEMDRHTDTALNSLGKKVLRRWVAEDEFCLAHEERARMTEKFAVLEHRNGALDDDIRQRILRSLGDGEVIESSQLNDLARRVRRVLEKFLLTRGEWFVKAVLSGDGEGISVQDLKDIVLRDLGEIADASGLKGRTPALVTDLVRMVISEPGEHTREYLRGLSDSYTLFSFLAETPDVQRAVTRMFSHGDIWLDTSFLLPMFLEQLFDEGERRFQNILAAAQQAGLHFWVTPGVIEELEHHTYNAVACARVAGHEWRSRVPFLLNGYMWSGRDIASFPSWVEEFRGRRRPQDDLALYLSDMFGIGVASLEKEVDESDRELRMAIERAWRDAHDSRRSSGGEIDQASRDSLIRHDVENYLGVIVRRSQERDSPFGYTCWFVTMDRSVFGIVKALRSELRQDAPISPVMTVDFLSNYLAIGPLRARVGRDAERRIPILIESDAQEFVSPALLDIARKAREDAGELTEHVIRRRVRDALDAARGRMGEMSRAGIDGVEERLRRSGAANFTTE